MGWLAEMARTIREKAGGKPKSSSIERLTAELRAYQDQAAEAREIVEEFEDRLDRTLLGVRDGTADDAAVERARDALRQARDRVADIERLLRKLQQEIDRERHNQAAALHAKRVADAKDAADAMTDAMQRMVAGADLIVAGARQFFAARDRFLTTCPSELKPPHPPHIWGLPGVFVARYIGARCPLFRTEAMRGGGSLEQLAMHNEPMDLHAAALSQVFPPDPPAQAA